MNNKKGQMMGMSFIIGVVMLVVAILLITSFWPTIQDSFDVLRGNSSLNCKSTTDVCDSATPAYVGPGSNNSDFCYDAVFGNSHTTTCAMLSIGPPLIMIMLILGAIGLIMRSGQPQPQMQYQGY